MKPTPPPLEEIIRQIQAHRKELARLGARHIDIFGSCSRSEQGPGSNIDLIVHLEPGFGYFDLGEMKSILDDEFKIDVNPVLESGIPENHSIRKGVVRAF